MEIRRGMYELAAMALASHPEVECSIECQAALCRQYGVFFEEMTDDEFDYLYSLTNKYMGE